MNLFKSGNTRRKMINSKINEKIGKIKLSELKFTLENRLTGLIDLYNLRKELLKISEESVKSSSLNLEISNKRFKAGTINSFNFRDIQLIYLNTIFGKLQAMYNLIDTSTEILRLTG
jgi:SET domain-containing protein